MQQSPACEARSASVFIVFVVGAFVRPVSFVFFRDVCFRRIRVVHMGIRRQRIPG